MPPFTGHTSRCRHAKDVHRGLDGSSWVEAICADGRVQISCRYCGRVYCYRVPDAVAESEQAAERDLFTDDVEVSVSFAAAAAVILEQRRGRRPRGGGPSAA